jgi:hypothetical protein
MSSRAWCAGDPPPTDIPVPPDGDIPERDRDDDGIPDVPGSEPPPVPIRDPRPDGQPSGPYVS